MTKENETEQSKATVIPVDHNQITQNDYNEFMDYVVGASTEPPAVFQRVMNSIVNKMQTHTAVQIVNSMKRQAKLQQFISRCEDKIFDLENFDDLSDEEVAVKYDAAVRIQTGLQEFQRKFIVQNKIEPPKDTPQEKFVQKLMTCSPDKIEKLIEIIDSDDIEEVVTEIANGEV